ncbi:SMODS domain-containing nucleotidyltransferase [Legionella maceachernii]|uniref:Nucleotidyltransferase n=1 Tax=Legionella maceachernii TaxID=466 RepID=A0A0W0VYE2_9GAMM|nr:hypothetical protein [Legionella maceachernii]KTD25066.1 hypothetical protein Lmac_2044 [Legionella maceachernii]SKA12883.1 hypothetical protein SAMN02745128_02195 [Legionella maceachernii]SUP04706.1 Uncharacterised protein [Legionella maceachernii]
MTSEQYLNLIITKYNPRNLLNSSQELIRLKTILKIWANSCYLDIIESGSRAKGTAISIASDVDYVVSLTSNCNESDGGLKSIYDSLFKRLSAEYPVVRKQNVSCRINLNNLQVDVTPAKKHNGNTNYHWIYRSESNQYHQTNMQQHINDILTSGRIQEIKIVKIWRELNKLDIPSIYLEYLIIKNILLNKPKDPNKLGSNAFHIFTELAKDTNNPLFSRVVDPANSNNILSDLITQNEKFNIIKVAKIAAQKQYWDQIVW